MQLFNEINCRKIFGERNVFAGVTANPWFLSIMATTFALQVVMTQWGGLGLGCVAGGLTLDQVRVVSTRTMMMAVWLCGPSVSTRTMLMAVVCVVVSQKDHLVSAPLEE